MAFFGGGGAGWRFDFESNQKDEMMNLARDTWKRIYRREKEVISQNLSHILTPWCPFDAFAPRRFVNSNEKGCGLVRGMWEP